MNFHVLTLFPDMVMEGLHTSILGRSMEAGLITLHAVNIRDYTLNKHKKVDDYPYGGGAGMLMQAQPVYDAWLSVIRAISERKNLQNDSVVPDASVSRVRTVYLTPQGKTFDQSMARELAREEDLILLCGHYEGIDERVLEETVTDFISIGDYVLTGGELPAMVMIDAVSRMVPGVLGNKDSKETESFSDHLLEYPQYSRPEIWREKRVPEILLSGDHAKVEEWRLEQSLAKTEKLRPDLYEKWVSENQEYFIKKEKREERRRRKQKKLAFQAEI